MNAFAISEALGNVPEDLIALCLDDAAETPAHSASEYAAPQAPPVMQMQHPVPQAGTDEKPPVQMSRVLPAAAVAACFVFAAGAGVLMLRGGDSSGYQESSVPVFAEITQTTVNSAAVSQTSVQSSAVRSTVSTAASVTTHTETVSSAEAETAPPESETAVTVTEPPAATAAESETAVTTSATDDGIPTVDVPADGVYVFRDPALQENAPAEVRISSVPELVFVIQEDADAETPGSISVRYQEETITLSEGVYLNSARSGDASAQREGVYLSRAVFADISGDGVPELCMSAYSVPAQVVFTLVFEPVERKLYSMGEIGSLSEGGWEMFEVAVDSGRLGGIRRTYYPPEERDAVHENSKAYGTFRLIDSVLYFIEDNTGIYYS